MEPIFFVMAIMGCGDAGDLCAEARIAPARYTSIQACQADMGAVLARNADLSFPVIAANCRTNRPRMAAKSIPTRG